MTDMNFYHNIGKIDMLCELFMLIRLKGREATLKELALEIKDNVHAKWFLENNMCISDQQTLMETK